MYSDTLKRQVPDFISSTQTFTGIYNAEDNELNAINTAINDIKAQLDIDKATWGLDIYEKELNITTNYTKSYADRRSVIKSKWRGSGTLNAALLKSVCDSFTNGDVSVTFDGTIQIKFNSIKGIPPNMSDLQNTIEQIKPAYLQLVYAYTYNLWSQVSSSKWGDVSTKTWLQLATI